MDSFARSIDRLTRELAAQRRPGANAPEDYPELLAEWTEVIAWYGEQAGEAQRAMPGPRGTLDAAPIYRRIARGSMLTALRGAAQPAHAGSGGDSTPVETGVI